MEDSVKFGVGTAFSLIILLGLTLNILLFLVWSRRKQLRQPTKYFLVSLAVADIFSIGFWTLVSAVSAFNGGWMFNTRVCQLQEFAMSFTILINMHTFMILALERLLFILKPSRHREICMNTVIVIILVSLWLFDGLLSIFPFTGWGEITYFENQFQCSMDTEQNTRQMKFATAIAVGIPFTVMVGAYVVILIRLRLLQKANPKGGQIVLEKDTLSSGDSYGARLRRQQLKFQNAGMKNKKPVLGLTVDENGYAKDESSEDETNAKKDDKLANIYYLFKSDVVLIKTYIIISATFIILWLPYIIVTYILTYERYHGIPDSVFYVFVILTHCTVFVKPLIYVLQNETFRYQIKKAFRKSKYRNFERY